jgi:hypothetical protein
MPTPEEQTDEVVYQALLNHAPTFVVAITDLVKAGQTPAQIEQHLIVKFGSNQTTRNARHVAEHVASTTK